MDNYYAVPQRTRCSELWRPGSACLRGRGHGTPLGAGRGAVAIACGTYEIGYIFALLALVVWLLRRLQRQKRPCWTRLPRWAAWAPRCVPRSGRAQRRNRQQTFSSPDIPAVLRVTVRQMARRSLG